MGFNLKGEEEAAKSLLTALSIESLITLVWFGGRIGEAVVAVGIMRRINHRGKIIKIRIGSLQHLADIEVVAN